MVISLWNLVLATLATASAPGPTTCFVRLFASKRPVSAYFRLGLRYLFPFVVIFGAICDCSNPLFVPLTFLSWLVVAPVSSSTGLCSRCGLLQAQSWWRLGASRILLSLVCFRSKIDQKLKVKKIRLVYTYVSIDLFFERLFKSLLLLLLGVAFLLTLASVALNFVEMVVHYCILQLIFHG